MITSAAQGARDHPRVCGEHLPLLETFHEYPGSSPRMRGARIIGQQRTKERGIIPAYAGSTRHAGPRGRASGDHPRVCGEHLVVLSPFLHPLGSSPRMRGALQSILPAIAGIGIIPAYAGSTIPRLKLAL